eukprot:TRINITY_DN1556_c0_g1_i2.p2 TRINITY_DN1556_c0_g1~~TRINITY_DN1556_c0_g1_i2.p2  ORF type:complete len:283 (+),score=69.41 TRINITY_DN1556_c0_g1_i2:85-849(+)
MAATRGSPHGPPADAPPVSPLPSPPREADETDGMPQLGHQDTAAHGMPQLGHQDPAAHSDSGDSGSSSWAPNSGQRELTAAQAASLQLLRRVLGEEEAEAQGEAGLLRFLPAAGWKVTGPRGAAARVIATNTWRRTHLPIGSREGDTSLASVREVIARGKMQLLDRAERSGCPVLLLNFGEIVKEKTEVVTLLGTYVYLLEQAIAGMSPEGPQEVVTLVNVGRRRRCFSVSQPSRRPTTLSARARWSSTRCPPT